MCNCLLLYFWVAKERVIMAKMGRPVIGEEPKINGFHFG